MGCKSTCKTGGWYARQRINRYIVGCKYEYLRCLQWKHRRINRYIVGCKCMTPSILAAEGNGINRYIVGCKRTWKVCQESSGYMN